MSPISVTIEVSSWMKKYLIYHSENKKEPLEYPYKHEYNLLLTRLTSNRVDVLPDNIVFDHKYKNLKTPATNSETIKICLPFSKYKDIYFYNKISNKAKILFREQVKDDMLYDFFVSIKKQIMSGYERKIAIENFFLKFNITEDDLKYDSFYRKYTRYVNKIAVTV